MMHQIDDLERVIQDLKMQSNVKSLHHVNSKDYEENYAMKLANSQEEYSDLKITCTRMESNSLLLECLAKDPKDWPKTAQVEENIKSLKAERIQDKMAIEDQERGIETLAEELQTSKLCQYTMIIYTCIWIFNKK
ncbi:hypothetical protein QZH41_015102 [Actinostola sp. cb2023]|nr:hypothetical protein QZH41_015102 [Actinostola sp. cb2023]